jgi:hypothetical protein
MYVVASDVVIDPYRFLSNFIIQVEQINAFLQDKIYVIFLILLSPDWFFHRDVRCLFEVGISMVMYAQVGLLVHALSILNFDGFREKDE